MYSSISLPSWGETMDDLVEREGLCYKKFTAVPFTGEVEGIWKGSIKHVKEEGLWEMYHDNGQLRTTGSYRNGEQEGIWIGYWYTGEVIYKGNKKNGKKEGYWVWYSQDGTVMGHSGIYKNDVKVSD